MGLATIAQLIILIVTLGHWCRKKLFGALYFLLSSTCSVVAPKASFLCSYVVVFAVPAGAGFAEAALVEPICAGDEQ